MAKTLRFRKRLLVGSEYQFAVVKLVLVQTLLTSLILTGVFTLFQHSQMELLARMPLGAEKLALLEQANADMFLKILGIIVLACVFQGMLAFILSHRAAGPMFRLKRYLSEISQGASPQPIQFRKDDHFKDVQDAYNEMVVVLEKERLNDLRIIEQIQDGIAQLKRLAREEQLFQMVEYIERLNNDLKNFKTH